ncbi:hypothetical protein STRDD10_01115 [Streptococcus sp. DD10]|nr:hypothetical protein STRDD10_01115 [Streptococcus sp. DD10]
MTSYITNALNGTVCCKCTCIAIDVEVFRTIILSFCIDLTFGQSIGSICIGRLNCRIVLWKFPVTSCRAQGCFMSRTIYICERYFITKEGSFDIFSDSFNLDVIHSSCCSGSLCNRDIDFITYCSQVCSHCSCGIGCCDCVTVYIFTRCDDNPFAILVLKDSLSSVWHGNNSVRCTF